MVLPGLPMVNITTRKDWGVSTRTNQSNLQQTNKQKTNPKQNKKTTKPQTLFDYIYKAKDKKNYAAIMNCSL